MYFQIDWQFQTLTAKSNPDNNSVLGIFDAVLLFAT